MAKREKCKFGLFKGRSSKFSSTLAFPASFYKGLEEFEADLDPKQIEKLLVFFEVMSTQEKISKVSFVKICEENLGKGKKIMFFIPGMDLYIMRRRQAGIQIGRWKFEIYENRLAASPPRFE